MLILTMHQVKEISSPSETTIYACRVKPVSNRQSSGDENTTMETSSDSDNFNMTADVGNEIDRILNDVRLRTPFASNKCQGCFSDEDCIASTSSGATRSKKELAQQ